MYVCIASNNIPDIPYPRTVLMHLFYNLPAIEGFEVPVFFRYTHTASIELQKHGAFRFPGQRFLCCCAKSIRGLRV